jgi:CheY-like chemotaxis protein
MQRHTQPLNATACLYVEDDPMSRDVMRVMMRRVPRIHTLTVFEDSHDFAARVAALPEQPGLILLDIHIAPMDGFSMLGALRQDPRYDRTRIIALTASVMNEEVSKLRTTGFDGAIAKPLSLHVFPSLVERILNGDAVWHIA